MESLSFIPAIVFFVSLSVYDYLSSRDRHCPRYRTRLMASSGGLILSSCFLLSDAGDAGGLFSALAVSEALMLASPGTGGSPSRTLTYSVAFLGLCLAIAGAAFAFGWLSKPSVKFVHAVLVIMSAIFSMGMLLSFVLDLFGNIGKLMDPDVLWNVLMLGSKLVHGIIFNVMIAVAYIFMASLSCSGMPVIFPFLLCTHSVVLFLASRSGHSFLVPVRQEEEIRLLRSDSVQGTDQDEPIPDSRLKVLHSRIVAYMEKEHPFLDPDFSMQKMARDLYSNKLYLSKAINSLAHKNFRQFVNYYRIEYAKDLFRKDPRLRINEASDMSGFHTVVSFNMAFKLNTGQTPSEWLHTNMFS